MSPNIPYLDTNHINEAKHLFFCGKRFVGIQVPTNIKTIVPKHIDTSYFPLGWKGVFFKDRMAHSSPKTS